MSYQETYRKWLESPALSADEKEELRAISGDDKEMEPAFRPAGVRYCGPPRHHVRGTHNMNVHVIRHATQAFAEVILAEGPEAAQRGVAVCFDCRNHSQEFAREAACVMAGNGIPVRLFDALRPTPELSFAIREYGCIAGINVTASHNPKEYNGYKVYWADGAQLPPPCRCYRQENGRAGPLYLHSEVGLRCRRLPGPYHLMGAETDEAFLSRSWGRSRPRRRGACGRRFQDRLHPLPRHRLQTHPRGPEAPGHEARALCSRTDGPGREFPHRGLPQSGEPGGLFIWRWTWQTARGGPHRRL